MPIMVFKKDRGEPGQNKKFSLLNLIPNLELYLDVDVLQSRTYKHLNVQISFVQSLEFANFEIGIFLYMKYVTYPGILAVAACPVEPTNSVGFMLGQLIGWESR